MFVHGCNRDTPIAPFKNYFDLRGHADNYNLRNNEDLATNQIRTNMGAHSTHTVGAILWNNTPKVITDITMQNVFKQELFEYYNNTYNDE